MAKPALPNTPAEGTREAWLFAATEKLRTYIATRGHKLPGDVPFVVPPKIRFAIAFPSTGKRGKRQGETWAPGVEDGHYEIILRTDLASPTAVLSELARQLLHAALPAGDSQHGKLFRDAALVVGFLPPMRKTTPGTALLEELAKIADQLPPLPHDAIDIKNGSPLVAIAPQPTPLNRPKTQRSRSLKAECLECAKTGEPFIVRVTETSTLSKGAVICPVHKTPFHVSFPKPKDGEDGGAAGEENEPEHPEPPPPPEPPSAV